MLIATDDACLAHDTGEHPERTERLVAIASALAAARPDLWDARRRLPPSAARDLARVHDPEMIGLVAAASAAGYAALDPDTVVSPKSWDAALAAAGQVAGCVRAVLAGEDPRAFAIVRPPGHHATRNRAMGFCLANNIAIGARVAQETGAERVAILDFDVHHGNGTQDIFWEDPSVLFVSLHRYPFYPGTGAADETGGGKGLGTTVNFPLSYSIDRGDYFTALARGFEAIGKFRPDILLVSAGFDAYRADPIGGLHLEVEDFHRIGEAVRATAESLCGGRTVSVLEGGYDLGKLGACVTAYVEGLEPAVRTGTRRTA
jgi:acetoin utilization deacetylase AcuC-like enzyme